MNTIIIKDMRRMRLKALYVSLISLMLITIVVPENVWSQTYYVTQAGGNGDGGNGSFADPWSATQFNNADNWSDVDDGNKIDPGDTVYLMGTISSRLIIQGNGSPDLPITIRGDYPVNTANLTSTTLSMYGGAINAKERSYITFYNDETRAVIDGGVTSGNVDDSSYDSYDLLDFTDGDHIIIDNWEFKRGWNAINVSNTNNIIIKRCKFTLNRMKALMFYDNVETITIGGGPEDGNEFYQNTFKLVWGTNRMGSDIYFYKASDILISYNHIHGTTGEEKDGWNLLAVALYGVHSVILEYNTIHDLGAYNSRGAFHVKGLNSYYPNHDIIIRYNNIYDLPVDYENSSSWVYAGAGAIPLTRDTYNLRIYGNRIHRAQAGITMNINGEADKPDGANGIDLTDIYIWGNSMSEIRGRAIMFGDSYSGNTDDFDKIYATNNSISNSLEFTKDDLAPIYSQFNYGAGDNGTDDEGDNPHIHVLNNAIAYPMYGQDSRYALQVTETANGDWLQYDYNLHYDSLDDGNIKVLYGSEVFDYDSPELPDHWFANDLTPTNPGFLNVANGDLTVGECSKTIDNGASLDTINIPSINIPLYCDEDITFSMDTILHPNTDWSVIPPDVITASQSDYGPSPEIGAYVYDGSYLPSPGILTVTPISFTELELSWKDKATDELGYVIQRSINGVDYIDIDTVEADISTFTDTGLLITTVYYYRVYAYNNDLESCFSDYASGQPGIPAPTELSVTSFSFEWVDLVWEDNSVFEEGFIIKRSLDGITYDNIDTVASDVTDYHDTTNLTAPTEYYYRVYGYSSEGNSDYTNVVTVTTGVADPTGLTTTPISNTEINLAWEDNSLFETGFQIERSLNGTDFDILDSAANNETAYADTGLSASTMYYYRVLAFNDDGWSGYSNISSTSTYSDTINPDDPVFNWNLEAENILLDEGYAQQNLTNHGSVTTGGSEPNPPGYGSVGAIFNGSSQYLSLSNALYGNRAMNGSDVDGTVYLALNISKLETNTTIYLWSIYDIDNDERQIAIAYRNGHIYLLWGYNNGESYSTPIPTITSHTLSTNKDIIVGFSHNTETKEYTYMVKDVESENLYSIDQSVTPLTGTHSSTGNADMVIGGKHGGTGLFTGTIYWVRIYDEAHSEENMKAIINNTSATNITHQYKTSAKVNLTSYPNPFSEITNVSFDLTEPSQVSLGIYDISGQLVKTLVNRKMDVGSHSVQWDGCNENGFKLPQGTYCCRLTIDNTSIRSGKILIMR